jgi:hypothetical protein
LATHIDLGLTPEEMADKNPATLRPMERWETGGWIPTRMKDLKPYHTFRYADDTKILYTALDNPYVNDFYVWSIKAERCEIKEFTEE